MPSGSYHSSGRGRLLVIGMGPGNPLQRTYQAVAALESCNWVFGYNRYIKAATDLLTGKNVVSSAMRQEVERCKQALRKAAEGETVALLCSGDSGVYAMAGLTISLKNRLQLSALELEIIPGMTAALAAGAALGAPLSVDYVTISLSDLLTPWPVIEKRLLAAVNGDFVIAIYNPRSNNRYLPWKHALEIVQSQRPADLPCGIVCLAGTVQQTTLVLPLSQLPQAEVDMLSLVIIGNSQTQIIDGKILVCRNYHIESEITDQS